MEHTRCDQCDTFKAKQLATIMDLLGIPYSHYRKHGECVNLERKHALFRQMRKHFTKTDSGNRMHSRISYECTSRQRQLLTICCDFEYCLFVLEISIPWYEYEIVEVFMVLATTLKPLSAAKNDSKGPETVGVYLSLSGCLMCQFMWKLKSFHSSLHVTTHTNIHTSTYFPPTVSNNVNFSIYVIKIKVFSEHTNHTLSKSFSLSLYMAWRMWKLFKIL